MATDFFERSVDLVNELRSEQFKVREYLQKGKYRLKPKFFNKGKKHYDFDLNSQEYFHEELHDLAFDGSEVQEQFVHHLLRLVQEIPEFRHQGQSPQPDLPHRFNQADVRQMLFRFFSGRVNDLEYEKYQIMERLHNTAAEEEIGFVRSRVNLIDRELQMAIQRAERLGCEDGFEETYTGGAKPVPVNENGQSIYKYLEEEECWFSNIHRDDIAIYHRYHQYRREVLQPTLDPLLAQARHLVTTFGVDLLLANEAALAAQRSTLKEAALVQAQRLIAIS